MRRVLAARGGCLASTHSAVFCLLPPPVQPGQVTEQPADGAYIHGLCLEGGWAALVGGVKLLLADLGASQGLVGTDSKGHP